MNKKKIFIAVDTNKISRAKKSGGMSERKKFEKYEYGRL